MKILKKYLGFKTYNKDERNILYCKDSFERDWYDIQYEDNLCQFIGETCIMVEDNRIISISNEPGRMYPSDSDFYILKKDDTVFDIGDYIKIYDSEVIKSSYSECVPLDEKISFYKCQMVGISKKITELEDIGLSGDLEYIGMQKQLEEYRQKYINACHELALTMN